MNEKQSDNAPTIEAQITELERAGWKRWHNHLTIWESPNGSLWRGPHGAWKALQRSAK